MGFPTSLIGRHDYLNALDALGLVIDRPAFPTVLPCPLCQTATLYLFDDVSTNGLWFSCDHCRAHGDIITFGGQVWNLSLPDTLEKFSDLGFLTPEFVARILPEYVKFSAKVLAAETFWDQVATQTWTHGDDFIACRLREFGVRHENPLLSDVVGVATYEQVRRLCGALGRTKPTAARKNGCALVYPFYDIPGRLTGFLIGQYADDCTARQNFVPINNYKKRRTEAGYFLLGKLLHSNIATFRGAQFAAEDIHWVLKAQARHCNKFNTFLPLVASYTGPEANSYGNSWNSLHQTTRIFHATAPTPGVISRACSARGYVSVCQPKHATDAGNLITVRAHTKTWQDALSRALLAENEIHAKAFAAQLSVPHDKMSVFLNKFEHPFSPGFAEQVLADLRLVPLAAQDRWLLIEKETSWWTHVGRPIINARPQITKIIQADTGQQLYVGTITAEDGEIFSFTDTAAKIERAGLLAYSRAVLAAHKKLVIYDRLWNGRSLLHALQLHPPELVNVTTRCGWDGYNKTFRFNHYEIDEKGAVVPITPWPDSKNTIYFDEPVVPAPLPVRAFLTPAHENSYPWCLVAGVLSQLLAPTISKDPAPIGLPRQNFNLAKNVLAALCCRVERATAVDRNAARRFFERFNASADWPSLAYNMFSNHALNSAVVRQFNQPLLMQLSDDALSVAPGYGWWALKSGPATGADVGVLRHVLPAYVQRVIMTRFAALHPGKSLVLNILQDLHTWLNTVYGVTFNLAHAKTLFFGPDDAHVAAFKNIGNAVLHEKIALLPHPRHYRQARNFFLKQTGSYWINRHAVDRVLWLAKSPPPNWNTLIELLDEAGVYKGEQTIQNMSGIVVTDAWCEQFWPDEPNVQTETG